MGTPRIRRPPGGGMTQVYWARSALLDAATYRRVGRMEPGAAARAGESAAVRLAVSFSRHPRIDPAGRSPAGGDRGQLGHPRLRSRRRPRNRRLRWLHERGRHWWVSMEEALSMAGSSTPASPCRSPVRRGALPRRRRRAPLDPDPAEQGGHASGTGQPSNNPSGLARTSSLRPAGRGPSVGGRTRPTSGVSLTFPPIPLPFACEVSRVEDCLAIGERPR